jgi:hypothetical protein
MAMRRCNELMQSWVEAMRGDLASRRQAIRAGLRANRIARNREFASVLHSERRLRHVLGSVASPSTPGADNRATLAGG